jgi:lipopolysaccharide export system permease protein
MKVLTRYLLRAHIGPLLFAFGALTGVILINTIARQMADLAGKGLTSDVIFQFFLLSLPSNVALTLPMAVLVAVLYTFSQLAAENEISALKASGIDLRRMILPLLLVAAAIAGGMAWFNDRVLPESNHQWRQLMVDIAQKSPLLTLREQAINVVPTGGINRYYLQASQIHATTNQLRDVVIYDVSEPRLSRTIYADSGTMAFNATRTDLFLTLYNGYLHEVSFDEPQNFQRLEFQQQIMRIPDVGNELQRQSASGYRGDREMTTAMLQARIDTLRTELGKVHENAARVALNDLDHLFGRPVETASPSSGYFGPRWDDRSDPIEMTHQVANDIRSSNDRAQGLERQIREFRVEVQKKFSIASATLVFVLIGAPLALRFPRGGIGMVIAASLIIFAIYYVGLIGGETLADEGYVSPIIAMWFTNILMGVLGLIGVMRMGRESTTQRGGGLAERLRGIWDRRTDRKREEAGR